MIKRSAIAVAVTLVLAVSAFARTSEPVNNVGGVFMQPLAQRFNASGFWLALHPQIATVTTDADGLLPAPGIDLEKKQRDEITVTAVTPRPNGNDKDRGKPKDIVIVKAGSSKADLRTLPQDKPEKKEREEREEPPFNPIMVQPPDVPDSGRISTQSVFLPQINALAPPPLMNFDGLDFETWGAGHPPDTNGDVGPNYYIQTINTSIGIFRKSDGVRVAAFTFNTLMSQGHFGNLCDTDNFGDPVVLYDTFEDRWIITDFAFKLSAGSVVNPPGAYQCFAASMSGDPVSGGWNFYSINTNNALGDYPKFGIWPDGLYMSANMFPYPAGGLFLNSRVYAFNKAQMYAGSPTVQVVSFDLPNNDFTLLPSNARLQTGAPPVGTPNFYVSTSQFLNALTVYKFHVDWDKTSLSTFTGPEVPINATSWPNANVPNAPSQGGNALDVLQIRAMMQNQYTNLGGAESLWLSHTVRRPGVDPMGVPNGFAAPRWYQVGVAGGTVAAATTQGTTWDPDGTNVIFRFMPSLAVDRAGNMALGYSTSSSTTKPAIKYAGRLSTDPVNTFSQTEQVLIQGTGTQSLTCGGNPCTRWGDYSAMTLDPDGCTFWYTNMYYAVDGLNHVTRVGSFRFAPCTPVGSGGSLSGTVSAAAGGTPISGATVTFGSRVATTDNAGFYVFLDVPAGNYSGVAASAPGYNLGNASSVAVTDGGTTTVNFSLSTAVASACLTDTTQADFQRGVATNVDLTTSPGDVLLFAPSLDQQQFISAGSGNGITTTQWLGQTFVPSVTGQLNRLDVDLFCSGCSGTNPPITIEIRTASGGLPTSTVLATTTIPGFSSGSSTYYPATFASPATLTAGTQYAYTMRITTARTGTYAGIFSPNAAAYPNGDRVISTNSGASWFIPTSGNPPTIRDLAFKTYMQSGFSRSGSLVSSVKDANQPSGGAATWSTLSWNGSTPPSTSLKFQIASSNSAFGPFDFVGPDGTAATFFASSGASLSQFNGKRYLRYTAYLATTNTAVTPTLNDATICFVDTLPTILNIAAASATYGGTTTLSATLTARGNSVSGKTIAFTINGNAVGSAVTDVSGVAMLANVSVASLNAGNYPIGANFTGDSPTYFGTSGSSTLTINKAMATINVTPYDVTYDGSAHTATGTATGVLNESLTGLDLSGTTHTNAGDYTDTWTFTNSNYNNASGTKNDKIGKTTATISVTPYNVTYDGNAHTATGTATGVMGESLTGLDLSGTTHTNAGNYTDTWTFTNSNYNNASGTKNDKIGKATATISVTPYTVTYD
ncbi:MAG: hypothetical protein DMF59_13725, partial [Acidobacteria bacterium]